MKCYVTNGTGLDSVQLAERPEPGAPGPGEVLVDVHSVSLNYRDLMVADGRYSGVLDPPIITCADMAGRVVEVGEGVHEFKAGDRVLNAPFRFWPAGHVRPDWARTFVGGTGVDGVLAEQLRYPAVSLVKVPEHLSFDEGATFTIAGLTAWAAIVTHGHVRPGDWVLLHGTGGVSLFGAQIARLFSARTIVTTSNPEKAHLVKERLGVDATVDYTQPDWPAQVREMTRGGAQIVVEVAGGASLPKSIVACAPYGRIAMIGVLAGADSQVDVRQLLMRQLTIRGIFMESAQELRALVAAYDNAKLHPWVDRVFPFDAAADAYAHLHAQRHMGKVVIAVKQD